MAGGAWERVAGYLDNGNGNLDTYEVTVDSFKNQKGLMVPKGYTLDSATAYFYFPKQSSIRQYSN